MSSVDEDNEVSVCANCGKGEEESDKLKACTACKMVKYCNRECQIAHRPQHKRECRRRAAELHDKKLFKQPPPKEDCPICFLLLPTLNSGSTYFTCCGKTICSGCVYAPVYDDQGNKVNGKKCPFCRTPAPRTDEEVIRNEKKRAEANDPQAIYGKGINYRDGMCGYPQDYTKALECWHRAGELGESKSYGCIGYLYEHGEGVKADPKKALHYTELSAMMGSETARHNLGCDERDKGNFDRAIKHWMIAAGAGDADSLNQIKGLYSNGYATKEDYTKALQSYQVYLSEIKSDQRDEAAAANEGNRYY